MSKASDDVLAERQRQIGVEGFSPEADGLYTIGELADAAACYVTYAGQQLKFPRAGWWPWSDDWWKPTTRRRDLVKAAALIIAEIDRLDRLEKPHD